MAKAYPRFGGLEEIKNWGWNPTQLAREIDRFRDRTIKGLTDECFGDPEFFGELLFENQHIWKIIYDRPENILGFWQLTPLSPDAYRLSEQGQICAGRIKREIVPVMQPGNVYDAYFITLSICPSIRKSLVMIQFSATIIQGLLDLAKQDIYIGNLSMCFASRNSVMMNKYFLQFEECAEHPFTGSKVYRTHLPTFLKSPVMQISIGSNMRQLIKLYREASLPLTATA